MKPLAPRNWELDRAIHDAKKRILPLRKPKNPGNVTPWFNGSDKRKGSQEAADHTSGARMTAPLRTMPVADETIVVLRRHQDFAEVFRHMQKWWGLTNSFIEHAGNFAPGQADKYLGPSTVKNWGPETFDFFCEILAIEFHAKVDIEAAKRMAEVWDGRAPRWFPEEKMNTRISKKLLARAKPLVFKENGRLGGLVRANLLTPKQRSDIARKAARAKHRKRRATARAARAAKALPAEPCERDRHSSAAKHTICVSGAG